MTVRPIIFSGPMVRALLGGTKTQTRRVLKPRGRFSLFDGTWTDDYVLHPGNAEWRQREARFAVGDLLYVREAWARTSVAPIVETIDKPWIVYRECDNRTDYGGPWKPSIHLPRADSRITLKVTGVKVERVQDISEEDAKAEGCEPTTCANVLAPKDGFPPYRSAFAILWDSINAKRGYGWSANPWVVAVSFEVIKANVDSLSNPGPGD